MLRPRSLPQCQIDRSTTNIAQNLLAWVSQIGRLESDDRGTRTRKTTLVLVTVVTATIVIPWGMFYVAIGIPRAGVIPLTYAAVSYGTVARFARTGDDRFLRYEQIVLFLALPGARPRRPRRIRELQRSRHVHHRRNRGCIVLRLGESTLGSGSRATPFSCWPLSPIDPVLRRSAPDLSESFIITFFAINMITTALMVFISMTVYVRERRRLAADLDEERARSDRLLLNVLPASIAERLKEGERPIADRYDDVAILFADIVDFTPLSESLSADDLVDGLNDLFSVFDELALKHGVEKVKTIGDSYMAISGAPVRGADASALASLALDMRAAAADIRIGDRTDIAMRFGMDVGPVVAGVIGESKFIYDVYGDTVNMASRMESHGETNRIQITERAASQLRNGFDITERGPIMIKGKGTVTTYFLNATK